MNGGSGGGGGGGEGHPQVLEKNGFLTKHVVTTRWFYCLEPKNFKS